MANSTLTPAQACKTHEIATYRHSPGDLLYNGGPNVRSLSEARSRFARPTRRAQTHTHTHTDKRAKKREQRALLASLAVGRSVGRAVGVFARLASAAMLAGGSSREPSARTSANAPARRVAPFGRPLATFGATRERPAVRCAPLARSVHLLSKRPEVAARELFRFGFRFRFRFCFGLVWLVSISGWPLECDALATRSYNCFDKAT